MGFSFEGAHSQEIRTYGLRINVTDLDQAIDFYSARLGFEVEGRLSGLIVLKDNENKVVLQKVPHYMPERDEDASATLTLQVNDLDSAIVSLQSKNIDFGSEQKRKEGVGYAIYVRDPFGKKVSLMQQTIVKTKPFREPKIYNYGFLIPDIDEAIAFYSGILGFVQRSQKYLPTDMPLGHADGSFGFMLHFREGTESIKHNSASSQHVVIMFKTQDLELATNTLRKKGVQFLQKDFQSGPLGRFVSFYDPSGYISDLIEVRD
jgi:glyoxylase I family protein